MSYKSSPLYPFSLSPPLISSPFVPKEPLNGINIASQNDNKNGYRTGDIVATKVLWGGVGTKQYQGEQVGFISASVNKTSLNISVDRNNKDAKLCILAIPRKHGYGASKNIDNETLRQLNADFIKKCDTKGDAYTYVLFVRNPNYNDRYLYTSGTLDDGKANVITVAIGNNYRLTDSSYIGNGITSDRDANITLSLKRQSITYNTWDNAIFNRFVTDRCVQLNNDAIDNMTKNGLDALLPNPLEYYAPFTDATINILSDFLKDVEPLTQTSYLPLDRVPPYGGTGNSTVAAACAGWEQNIIASSVDTSLPVFTVTKQSLNDMYNYLMGRAYTPENKDDLVASEVDLKTDWTIYVKGARRPSIYVTEISKGLDDYIASDRNTMGLKKEDFYIQYRCPYWEEDMVELLAWNKTDIKIPLLPNKKYDAVLQTSYENLIAINYEGNYDIEIIQNLVYDMSNPAKMPYAQLQFRIYYNDSIFSSWCEFGIGYIGSPSIADFEKMNNWGIVTGINDGSTVTIIYDEYPDGYTPDGYDKPPNDSDDDITNPKPDTGNGTLPNTNGTNNGVSLLSTSYAVTDSNLRQLGNFLWTATIFDDIRLINNSPLDNIVSTKIMPIALTGKSSSLQIGNINTEINAEIIETVPIIDVGSLKWVGYYNNFLDYAPYTQAYIFLPFIGFYEIDPAQCVGHTLNVKYSFDIILGQCKAMLFVDNIYYMSYEGACGVDIPLTGNNRAQLESSFLASAVTSMLTANPLPLLMTAINSQFQSQRSGSYSPSLGWGETRRCFVVFMIPNSQYPRTYGHDNGYPCNLSYNLGQLSGFTQTVKNPDISGIACTDEEGEMIKQLLASGVYL